MLFIKKVYIWILNGYETAYIYSIMGVYALICSVYLQDASQSCGVATHRRSSTPTDARRPAGLRTSVGLTKFPNSSKALFENFVKPIGSCESF